MTIKKHKNQTLAMLLAVVVGGLGLLGIGHIYVGRVRSGIILLVIGLITRGLFWFFLLRLLFDALAGAQPSALFGILALVWATVSLVLWMWQTYDMARALKNVAGR